MFVSALQKDSYLQFYKRIKAAWNVFEKYRIYISYLNYTSREFMFKRFICKSHTSSPSGIHGGKSFRGLANV